MNGDIEPVPVAPPWKRDFPYEAQSEEEVTRREFARYLVLGAGTMAAANVGIAIWPQLRSINTGEPRAIVDLAAVDIGSTYVGARNRGQSADELRILRDIATSGVALVGYAILLTFAPDGLIRYGWRVFWRK